MKMLAFVMCVAAYGQQPAPAPKPPDTLLDLSRTFEGLAQTVSRAVVQISVSGYSIVPDAESGNTAAISRDRGTGSGVVLSADGYIMTNAHVVKGAQKVTVSFATMMPSGGAEEERGVPAAIVGVDPDTDLALIKVDRKRLSSLTLANSDLVRQGQIVLAFGSPLGLANSLTMGVVSSVGRQLNPDDFMQYIQTDAPINPGNSGGALVDGSGRVVGINTLILSRSGGSEGVGFAIPSNLVRSVFTQLKAHGHVHRGLIGVYAQNIGPVLAEGLSLPKRNGVIVSDVGPGGPADKGGLKIGDIVLTIDGVPIRDARQFEMRIFRAVKGQKVKFEVLREKSTLPLTIEVTERPEPMDKISTLADPRQHVISQLGILGVSVTKELAPMLPDMRQAWGVVVAAVTHDVSAANIELQPGDILHSINGETIVSVENLREQLAAMKSGASVVLQLERQGTLRFLGYRVE